MSPSNAPSVSEALVNDERDEILVDLIMLALYDEPPSVDRGALSPARAEARREAALRVVQDLSRLRQQAAATEPPEEPVPEAAEEQEGDEILPVRCVGKPLVTVRRHERHVTVTFTAALARAHGIGQFSFVAVRRSEPAGTFEFVLTNDPVYAGGTFTLGYNGGSSKKKGSPGRVFQIRPEALPLDDGNYLPRLFWEGERLVVRVG